MKMIPRFRLEVAIVTLAAILITCAQGLKIDFSRLAARHTPSYLTQKRNEMTCTGNPCEKWKPFLCQSSSKCITIKSICDGFADCEDGFDEDPEVCNAASRPTVEDMTVFLNNERKWMVPQLFNGASIDLIAHVLTVASGMNDLRESLGLTDKNVELLDTAFVSSIEGDERPLLAMGMPERSWHEVQYVFQKLYDSGFKV
ncbi:neuropeptide prohormone-4-like isoform X2 [Biomphalaria glabrata]|uniref:Neuropeptide prohormone-4-like isoform X2 n=1 Tax=Biomphalaria glabrata TaxID=6526 RepID=A0A2C9MAQ7_BIOGL|nr:neuropeptide prohormone-4-like isoform X2 [Biomphalaria glabrata]